MADGYGDVQVIRVGGSGISRWLDDVARLRIGVFREYPYLYDGDRDYEVAYLDALSRSAGGVLVLVLDQGAVVGASTGMPLMEAEEAIRLPFREAGVTEDQVFYFGESVLMPGYRGRGLGHRFFDEREAHARSLPGMRLAAFAAVRRSPDDPRRPPGHRGNDAFWMRRGYREQPRMVVRLSWKELGSDEPTEQDLTIWSRTLEDTR